MFTVLYFRSADLREAAVHFGLGISAEEIDVRHEVHQIDRARAGGTRSDFAEHDFAIGLPGTTPCE